MKFSREILGVTAHEKFYKRIEINFVRGKEFEHININNTFYLNSINKSLLNLNILIKLDF